MANPPCLASDFDRSPVNLDYPPPPRSNPGAHRSHANPLAPRVVRESRRFDPTPAHDAPTPPFSRVPEPPNGAGGKPDTPWPLFFPPPTRSHFPGRNSAALSAPGYRATLLRRRRRVLATMAASWNSLLDEARPFLPSATNKWIRSADGVVEYLGLNLPAPGTLQFHRTNRGAGGGSECARSSQAL